jgi:hypothetical protein
VTAPSRSEPVARVPKPDGLLACEISSPPRAGRRGFRRSPKILYANFRGVFVVPVIVKLSAHPPTILVCAGLLWLWKNPPVWSLNASARPLAAMAPVVLGRTRPRRRPAPPRDSRARSVLPAERLLSTLEQARIRLLLASTDSGHDCRQAASFKLRMCRSQVSGGVGVSATGVHSGDARVLSRL